MARYARKVISAGTSAWDAPLGDNFLNVFDRPIPLIKHAGDLTSLQSAFAAASYDQALAICQYSSTAGDGLIFAVSDGTAWRAVSGWQLFNRILLTGVTNTHSVGAGEDFIKVTGSNTFDLTLPAIAGSNTGRKITVKHNGTGTITVTPTGADTIDGAADFEMDTQRSSYAFISDGVSDWMVV